MGATRPFTTPGAAPPHLLSPVTRGLGGALAREEQASPAPDDQTGLLPHLVGHAAADPEEGLRPAGHHSVGPAGVKWPGDRHAPMMARGGLTEAREGQPPAPPQRQVRRWQAARGFHGAPFSPRLLPHPHCPPRPPQGCSQAPLALASHLLSPMAPEPAHPPPGPQRGPRRSNAPGPEVGKLQGLCPPRPPSAQSLR